MATPRKLGEMLATARSSKGIDLERAARDTKIRSRYLSALEAGDFRSLPGAVYTKGFLRNYAQYLGLDPDVIVNHYRRELGGRGGERVSIVSRTLRAPRAGLTITPGLLIAGVLTLAVLAFGAYIAIQFIRFVQPPVLAVTQPASVESTIDAATTTLIGTTSAGATVTITGPDGPVTTTASANGAWSADVPLRKGRNEFIVTALDPQTNKHSGEQRIIVLVPVPEASPTPAANAPKLSLTSPADGKSFTGGAIPITGTTDGQKVTVSATVASTSAGAATPSPKASPSAPAPAEIAVKDGKFNGTYTLTPGTWTLTVTATGAGGEETAVTRHVTVTAPTGVNVTVQIKGGRVWLRVRLDGNLAKQTPSGGMVFDDGTKLTFKAKDLVEIRTGVPRYTFVTVNGVSYGALGTSGNPGVWGIGPTGAPKPE
jgi:cytoskeletal protein RodZ